MKKNPLPQSAHSLTTKPAAEKNVRKVEISRYLWGRLRSIGELDEMTRQHVITAALISYVDGDAALAKFYKEIDPVRKSPTTTEGPSKAA